MFRSWLNPRSVTGLAGVFGFIFALGSIAIGAALYLFADWALNRAEEGKIAYQHGLLLAPINGHAPSTAQIAARIGVITARREISSTGFHLLDAQGRRIAGKVEVSMPDVNQRRILFRQWGDEWEVARARSYTLPDGARLTIVAESESAEDMGNVLLPLFCAALALAVSAGIGASVLLGRLIASRLAALGTTAGAIIAGDYSRRVPVDSLGGLFAEQARIFNRMLDRIEELMDNLRRVSSDLAHDLRTPLTRLQATLREAGLNELDVARRQALIRSAERECDAVLSLFSALLRIGEVEAGRRRVQTRLLHVEVLVEDAVESYVPAFADAGRCLMLGICAESRVLGDADLFNQLLVNLIENALLHTPEGTTTRVSVRATEAAVVLEVRDDGAGIPVAQRQDVLGRFVRLEHNQNTPGHGLGLALVVAIAKFHDAEVELADAGPGLIVRVRFSTAAPAVAAL